MRERNLHVMVLDSDVDVLSPLYRQLSDRGCRVATYSSPWAACQYAEEECPHAILTSIEFPGCYGLEIVRQLKQASPGSRIFVLTPHDNALTPDDVRDAGGEAMIPGAPGDEDILTLVKNLRRSRIFLTRSVSGFLETGPTPGRR